MKTILDFQLNKILKYFFQKINHENIIHNSQRQLCSDVTLVIYLKIAFFYFLKVLGKNNNYVIRYQWCSIY